MWYQILHDVCWRTQWSTMCCKFICLRIVQTQAILFLKCWNMADPPLSDIDFQNELAWAWTTLNFFNTYLLLKFRVTLVDHYSVHGTMVYTNSMEFTVTEDVVLMSKNHQYSLEFLTTWIGSKKQSVLIFSQRQIYDFNQKSMWFCDLSS